MESNHRVEVPLLNHLYYGIEPYPPAIEATLAYYNELMVQNRGLEPLTFSL